MFITNEKSRGYRRNEPFKACFQLSRSPITKGSLTGTVYLFGRVLATISSTMGDTVNVSQLNNGFKIKQVWLYLQTGTVIVGFENIVSAEQVEIVCDYDVEEEKVPQLIKLPRLRSLDDDWMV